MPKAFVSTVINAPIERVWRVASDFNGLAGWMPGMKESVIEPGKKADEIAKAVERYEKLYTTLSPLMARYIAYLVRWFY